MTTVFTGDRVNVYVALTLRKGLELYKKTRMLPNRQWTPTNMLRKAGEITGKKFKRGQYDEAIAALTEWIDEH